MNSNYITFDHQSGRMRRDFVRESAARNLEIFVPEQPEVKKRSVNLVNTKLAQAGAILAIFIGSIIVTG